MSYLPYVEKVVEAYSRRGDIFDPMKARVAFEGLCGQYTDTDPWYEERSRLFFDFLVFDYPSLQFRSILHRHVAENWRNLLEAGTLDIYRGLLATQPSVFEIRKVGEATVVLNDLIGLARFEAKLPEEAYGFSKGIIICGRVIPFMGRLVLGRGMILHPDLASPYILKLMDDLRKEQILSWNAFFLLSRMKLQCDMSPTFKLSSIYSSRSFLIKR